MNWIYDIDDENIILKENELIEIINKDIIDDKIVINKKLCIYNNISIYYTNFELIDNKIKYIENNLSNDLLNIGNIILKYINITNNKKLSIEEILTKEFYYDILYIKNNIKYICDFLKYKIIIFRYNNFENKSVQRNSYNFCDKYPICFEYYNDFIDTKYKNKNKCLFDHLCINKLFYDIENLIIYIDKIKCDEIINIDCENIIKSLNTIKFVCKKNYEYIIEIQKILNEKSVKLIKNISFIDFLKFKY